MYIYYSMFGFQRVGDEIWAAADSRSRGFLFGATAGRTTLSGEGLQHEDGTSHLIASTVPNCRAYDPCFAYELAVILEDGMRRMLGEQEDVFYYVTLMNESYAMPSLPEGAREGILRGMHRIRDVHKAHSAPPGYTRNERVRLLGAGTILNEVLAAAELLEQDWGVGAEVYSVTSFTELRRDGMRRAVTPAWGRRRAWAGTAAPAGWSSSCPGPGRRSSPRRDYVSAVADLIRPWIADTYVALGTDGFGRSDTRASLRRFFEVDRALDRRRGAGRAGRCARGRGGAALRHRSGQCAALDALSARWPRPPSTTRAAATARSPCSCTGPWRCCWWGSRSSAST